MKAPNNIFVLTRVPLMDFPHSYIMIEGFCESYLAMADIPVFHHYSVLEILHCRISCSDKRQYPHLIPPLCLSIDALEAKLAPNRYLSISLVLGGVA